MCDSARAPPPESTTPTERPASRRASRPTAPSRSCGLDRVRLDRIEPLGPPGQRAGPLDDVVGDQVAAAQLGPVEQRGCGIAAAGQDQHAIGLLQAEVGPGIPVAGRPAHEQHRVAGILGAVEQRAERRQRRRARLRGREGSRAHRRCGSHGRHLPDL